MSENKRERRLTRQKNLGSLKLQTLNTPFLFLETQTQTNIYIYMCLLVLFSVIQFWGGVWREDHLSPAKSDGGGGSMSSRK